MHMYMVKVISLSNRAYGTLKSLKMENESFSDVVLKLATKEKKSSLTRFAGIWKEIPEMDKIFEDIAKDRYKSSERKIDLKW